MKLKRLYLWILMVLSGLLSGCSPLVAPKVDKIQVYALNAEFNQVASEKVIPITLLVNTTRAASGFDSPRIIYINQHHQINFFALNQWVDAPAKMINGQIVQALEKTSAFHGVVQTSNALIANVRLDTDLIRLQHEFTEKPSRVRLTIRAQLIDLSNRQVLITREFDLTENASSENPYGGVIAANNALANMLKQITQFCIVNLANFKPSEKSK